MRLHSNYHFKDDAPHVITTLYEFDTEEDMNASGLLNDKRRTTCFTSSGKWYVGGHFREDLTRCDICDAFDHDCGQCTVPDYACPMKIEEDAL